MKSHLQKSTLIPVESSSLPSSRDGWYGRRKTDLEVASVSSLFHAYADEFRDRRARRASAAAVFTDEGSPNVTGVSSIERAGSPSPGPSSLLSLAGRSGKAGGGGRREGGGKEVREGEWIPDVRELWLHAQELKAEKVAAEEKTQLAVIAREQYAVKADALEAQLRAAKELIAKLRSDVQAGEGRAAQEGKRGVRAAESQAARADEHVVALQVHIKALKKRLGDKLRAALAANASLKETLAEKEKGSAAKNKKIAALQAQLELVSEEYARNKEVLDAALDLDGVEEGMLDAEVELEGVQTRLREYVAWEEEQGFDAQVGHLLDPDSPLPGPGKIESDYAALKDAYIRLQYRAELLGDENAKMAALLEQLRGTNLILYTHAKCHAYAPGADGGQSDGGENMVGGGDTHSHIPCQEEIRALKLALRAAQGGEGEMMMAEPEPLVMTQAEETEAETVRADHWEAEAKAQAQKVATLQSQAATLHSQLEAEAESRVSSLLASDTELLKLQGQLMYLEQLSSEQDRPRWDALLALPSSVIDEAIEAFHQRGQEAEALATLDFKQAYEARGARIELLEQQAEQLRELALISSSLGDGSTTAAAAPPSESASSTASAEVEKIRLEAASEALYAEHVRERDAARMHLLTARLAKQDAIIRALDETNMNMRVVAATDDGLPVMTAETLDTQIRDARRENAKLEAELLATQNQVAEAKEDAEEAAAVAALRSKETQYLRVRAEPELELYERAISEREASLDAKVAKASTAYASAPKGSETSLKAQAKVAKRASQLADVRLEAIEALRIRLANCVCGRVPGAHGDPTMAAGSDANPEHGGDHDGGEAGDEEEEARRRGIRYEGEATSLLRSFDRGNSPPPMLNSRTHQDRYDEDGNILPEFEEESYSDSRELFAPVSTLKSKRHVHDPDKAGKKKKKKKRGRRKNKDDFAEPSALRILTMPFLAHALPTLATFALEPDEQELQDIVEGIASDEPRDLPALGYYTYNDDNRPSRDAPDFDATVQARDWKSAARKLRHEREKANALAASQSDARDAGASSSSAAGVGVGSLSSRHQQREADTLTYL